MGHRKNIKDKSGDVVKGDRYKEWIGFIFDNEAAESDLDGDEFKASNEEIVELIRLTCFHCGTDLKNHSNHQVDKGLCRLFYPFDAYVFSFEDPDVDCKDIVMSLQSIQYLYLDLFNERCDPVLSYLDEPTDNPLNGVCYMLWDVTPLSFWNNNPNRKQYYSAIATVMEKALYLSNPACVESALHGLGHIQNYAEELVGQILDRFLEKQKNLRPELICYANNARIGYIQ